MSTDTNKTMKMLRIVNLSESIEKLKMTESESIAIKALCDEYTKKLNEGKHEEELCESFVVELSKIATTENAKNILESLNESIKKNQSNISLAKDVYSLSKGVTMYVAPIIESAVVNYMLNKNKDTRDDVRVSMSLFGDNTTVKSILETLNFESYEEKSGKELVNASLKEEYTETPKKTYTEEEVNAIIENRVAVEKQKMNETPKKKKLEEMENRIDLHGMIKNILKENSGNDKLRVFCEKYIKALNEGRADEVLYESFISGISNWNYLSAVDTELSALNDRINKYKQEINLKKVLEMMKETGSYYIVPLIEDVVVDYAENKNMRTRALMLQRLESFEYDPFVRDIMSIASRDLSVENTVWLGESVEMVNNYVKAEKIYSPVLYLNENESVFNVRGTYYKRLGDVVSKLGKKDVSELSESFKNLCDLVNSTNIIISEELNTITVYGGSNEKAIISESSITINGSKMKVSDIDRLASTARMMNETESASFYAAVKVLNENFDNIACVDFVKRVSAKDNSGLCVDVFKINENICVNTINIALGKSVFYKNVNPIQCRKYINEHMGINVAPLFEDVLPDQENTKKNIEAKKQEYESYIKSLEDKKETLEKMKDEASDTDDIDDAIEMINKEIEDTKNDYKKYQKDADDFLNGKEDDKEEEDKLKDQKDSGDETDKTDDADKDKTDDTEDNPDDKENDNDQTEGEPKESPEDMEQPITGDGVDDEPIDEPDEYADVQEFDPDFDIAMTTVDVPASEEGQGSTPNVVEDTEGYKVVRVSYNKNVKTGKTSNKGEVIVIIPSVDANGDVHDDMRKITFTLDTDRRPIVNNEYMPLAMYNAIVNAIDTCPETENVSVEGDEDLPDPDNDGSGDGGALPVPTEDKSDVPATTADEVAAATIPPVSPTTEAPVENDVTDTPADDTAEASSVDIAPVEAVKQETPAEIQDTDQKMTYPISFGIYPEEIAPKDMGDFTKDLDNMKIKHTESEAGDGEVCIEVANKAQCEALKKYIKDWFNYTDENLKSFVPELCECGVNECGSVKESVNIKGVRSINESKNDRFSVVVPATDVFCEMFNVKNDGNFDSFSVIAENEDEAQKFYNKLYEHSLKNEVDQDITDILEKYAPKYKENAEKNVKYNLTVPYNGFLESKLEARGFNVETVNEDMKVEILSSDYVKTKKLLESVYGNEVPEQAKNFIDFVNENIIITIKDESTGKTVEIDVDSATSNDASDAASEGADFDSSFKDTTTFDPEKSMLFKDDEDSAEDEKKDESEDEEKKSVGDEDENKEDENKDEGEKEDEKKDEDEEKKDKEKPKKKFKFKSSKKESSNESVKENENKENKLNEEAAANTVLDIVEIPDGRKGQVISQLADGTLIVNVEGHTLPFDRKQLKAVNPRPDNLDFPVKFDPLTLKGVIENYVSCGMFLNNVQVTPNDCKVKLLEYIVAKPEDEINIIIEGEATKTAKKYIKITENLNDVLDLANYAEGKMTLNIEGKINESDVLIHIKDYMHYKNVNEETCPVRTLVYDENGETHLRYINGTQLRLNESSDVYVPDYINDLNKAMLLYK